MDFERDCDECGTCTTSYAAEVRKEVCKWSNTQINNHINALLIAIKTEKNKAALKSLKTRITVCANIWLRRK